MDWRELDDSAEIVAPRLLGCELVRELAGQTMRVRIVETEAYRQDDAASHSYRGRTPRTDVMFGPSGVAYVYFTYGLHYCLNVVCGPVGYGTAVLIRAVEPITGEAVMSDRRAGRSGPALTNGPAKLCQALGIDKSLSGHNLRAGELRLVLRSRVEPEMIIQTTRVGITQARDVPWRFYLCDNPYVSKR